MTHRTPCITTLAATALIGVAIDQTTKSVVVSTIEGRRSIPVLGHVLSLTVSRNSGASFSFAPAATVVFTVLAVVVAGVIVRKASQLRSLAWSAALGLLLAGAVGNLCDRLFRSPGFGRGKVVDFIDLSHFATFNAADTFITGGVILALLLTLRSVPMGAPATTRDVETPADDLAP